MIKEQKSKIITKSKTIMKPKINIPNSNNNNSSSSSNSSSNN